MRVIKGSGALALLAVSACLAGCATSAPMRLYTLSPVREGAEQSTPPAVRVARVSLPGEIDRAELVQRIDATRLKLAEDDRWAAPLAEMISRTLSANLQSRWPAGASEPDLLYVDIEELIGDANCAVSLRAAWSLKRAGTGAGTEPSMRGYETVRVDAPAACEISVLPEGMSRALAELSSRIVSARSK